jgi:Tol biopolymer transport system component
MFSSAQEKSQDADSTKEKKATKGLPLEPGRTYNLNTNEGTWISLDVHPDGQSIAFDLMGDLYTIPITGGKAMPITEGMAYDTHPKFSPDGTTIAFTSDRSGSQNIWIMDLETKETTQITKDKTNNFQSAEWSPDGNYLVAAKGGRNLKLHMYHKDGGGGTQLFKEPENFKFIEPAFGPDERYVWYSQRRGAWNYNAQLPQYQIGTYDRKTGETSTLTNRYGSAFAPTLSPDGKWLVYGTRYNTETGLVKRNLNTGEESWLAYPVQHDEQESIATLGVYPAMSFTPDSKSLVTFYGGKIYRIPIDGGEAMNIPFEVDTELDLGPEVRFDFPISDDPKMMVNQIRDPKRSPDGSKVAFTALNRIYVMDFPDGPPKRLTKNEFTEANPVWSPDGAYIAYLTWEGTEGNIYKVKSSGGKPLKLTRSGAIYSDMAWDHQRNRLVFTMGAAQSYINAIGPFAFGASDKLAWMNADGGSITTIKPADGRNTPHFVSNNDRIFLYHGQKGLLSMRYDGTDEKAHLKVSGITTYPTILDDHGHLHESEREPQKKPSNAEVIIMAPEGDKAMAKINNDIYVVTVPMVGGETPSINVAKPDNANFPSWKLTEIGGEFPHWSKDGKNVNWSLGNAYFAYDLMEAERMKKELEAKKKAEEEEKDDEDKQQEQEESEEEEDEQEGYKASEWRIEVEVEKDIPQGRVLLQGARIITMKEEEVIENGDILIENARIKAVGTSGSLDIPNGTKTMDMSGKTITPGFEHFQSEYLHFQ